MLVLAEVLVEVPVLVLALAPVLVQASAPVLVRALAPVLVQESVLVSALAESREPEARALFPQFEFLQEKQIAGFRSSALL